MGRLLLALACCLTLTAGWAAPPNLVGVTRTQTHSPGIDAARTLRIWMFNIGQGDSILIELPPAVSTRLGNPAGDPVNILVDGGASPISLAKRAPLFLHHRYGQDVTIEHMVLTHHDRDHVVGLTRVLEDNTIAVDRVYASGLASFRLGVLSIPASGTGDGFVSDGTPKKRSLGRFLDSGRLESKYQVATLEVLKRRVNNDELNSDFGAFAKAVVDKTQPKPVTDFVQACFECGALDDIQASGTAAHPQLSITTIWPRQQSRRFGDWAKTTNGNSVAFNLSYGDFSILLTGDLNTQSEPEVLALLQSENRLGLLDVDIFKAAHHGSSHNATEFIQHPSLKPAVSVASMGGAGFMQYKHPDETLITTLGGALRFYSTFIREETFVRADLSEQQKKDIVEDTHVLIETDGVRFRIVEVLPLHDATIPDMDDVLEGNGTPWISAQ